MAPVPTFVKHPIRIKQAERVLTRWFFVVLCFLEFHCGRIVVESADDKVYDIYDEYESDALEWSTLLLFGVWAFIRLTDAMKWAGETLVMTIFIVVCFTGLMITSLIAEWRGEKI